MLNESQKTKMFRGSVLQDANEQITHMLANANDEGKRVFEKGKDELLKEFYNRISNETGTIKTACRHRVSKQSFESYRAVLKERNLLVNDFFASIETKVKSFVLSTDYSEYIKDILTNANVKRPFYDGVTVKVNAADYSNADLFKDFPVLKIEEVAKSKIKIGGIILFYPNERLYFDLTFDKKLKSERERFVNNAELGI